jgi:hypothetical protein
MPLTANEKLNISRRKPVGLREQGVTEAQKGRYAALFAAPPLCVGCGLNRCHTAYCDACCGGIGTEGADGKNNIDHRTYGRDSDMKAHRPSSDSRLS